MSNIEDDIKKLNKFNEYENTIVLSEEALYEIQDAIEHILSEREQDKARIKELEEELYSANKIINEYLDDIPNQREKEMQARIKELEEDLYSANKIINEYLDGIPKQKIKDKIENLEKEYKKLKQSSDFIIADTIQPKIEVLQELLQESEDK